MKNSVKVIVAGCRDWQDYEFVDGVLSGCPWVIAEIVSGGARGADALGERWARDNGVPLTVFPAEWNIYGKQAGLVRNEQMAQYADALIAFWDGESRGTQDMIDRAAKHNLRASIRIRARPW